jgi:hypothetical protein
LVDWVEVERAAHQLSLDHGIRAHLYAARLANEARAKQEPDDAEFWNAIAMTLTPREASSNVQAG